MCVKPLDFRFLVICCTSSLVLIIFEVLLSQALINAARQWPPMRNNNEQRHDGTALKNKLTGAPGWRPLLINIPCRRRLHHQCLLHHRSIFSPSDVANYDTTTKGGLSPDLRGNRTSSGHPPPKNIRRITPQLPELLCLLNKQSRQGVVPFVPKMDTTKTSV